VVHIEQIKALDHLCSTAELKATIGDLAWSVRACNRFASSTLQLRLSDPDVLPKINLSSKVGSLALSFL
jgi:hypothetical protein